MSYLGVGEVARELGVKPQVISDLIYKNAIDADRCPLICNRRMIPVEIVPAIRLELERRGFIQRAPVRSLQPA